MDEDDDYRALVDKARNVFETGRTKSLAWRKRQLTNLVKMLEENEQSFFDVLRKDLRKSKFESLLMDLTITRAEIISALEHLDEWAKDEPAKTDITGRFSKVYVRKEPYGVCLILGAWNFPVLLLLSPLVGAIAAGNCALLKPSELSLNTAVLLKNLIPKYLDKDCFPVAVTGAAGSTKLLDQNRFDLIFYTGGTQVGKLVMAAACKNLTPVVLELGGKNPCYIHKSSDLNKAARRVCFGKFANVGQICLAPDYILCDEEVQEQFIKCLRSTLKEFYGEDPKKSDSLGRIINDRHFNRVQKLMGSGKAVIGGETDATQKYIAPTVLTDVKEDSPIMQEEIFGPILPILTINGVDEAISFISKRERPLCLYTFSKDTEVINKVLNATSSGGVTINDTCMHHNEFLPFGGIGNSGMGNYHGKYSYDTFTHRRGCFDSGLPEMLLSTRYPPHTEKKVNIVKNYLSKKMPGHVGIVGYIMQFLKLALLGVVLAYFYQTSE